ncbi:hypothetical protein A3I46_02090 [Candidatus Kaiserbacteria bacterium RIFCSPLOWO2_02_FULL_54_13]|uniref:Uncharacterized protein n=2 Tax=Parcubacteria group TaxID=1794811 RepID=A0A1G2C7F7_9BACT|nr:MAG: hypothetical protein UY91_C0004G0007 [Parcubacteria group bacterium GW2011_GWB1_55_9]KKW47291.1 MAG: hypothetical protein UZ00_C0010G0005 [Parcubacteria group bacterium GW2011_GWA1_60_11]OGG62029.1 MAG: hypothetical protein A3C19_02845 [Candidatus Kaiserbacteria bacterium RIFCSPHIGHO2_02_FULL_54_22]OGG67781.1 MAG: hypothetical protein A3E99_03440 [Candidatus Kaiserbacteria bacterium RIFCSPHIGHO2_12_FULL_54_16]OGG82917.1 MAG: hypothetical protein A3I46_02090 [Candidatus Kaiserbacteria ba
MTRKFRVIQGGLGDNTGPLPKRMSFIDSLLESVYLGLALNFNLPDRLSLWAVVKLEGLHKKYGWPSVSNFFKLLATSDGKEE